MSMQTLKDLLIDQLRDLYSAETQLVKALPKLAKHASSETLGRAFSDHLDETLRHVRRLEEAAREIGFKPAGKHCKAMEGLIKEGDEALREKGEPVVCDAGLVAAAQRVEHYEISAYGTARAIAERLRYSTVVMLLEETLAEEKAADRKLTEVSTNELFAGAGMPLGGEIESED